MPPIRKKATDKDRRKTDIATNFLVLIFSRTTPAMISSDSTDCKIRTRGLVYMTTTKKSLEVTMEITCDSHFNEVISTHAAYNICI